MAAKPTKEKKTAPKAGGEAKKPSAKTSTKPKKELEEEDDDDLEEEEKPVKKGKASAGLIATDFGGTGNPVKGKGSEGKKQLSLTECYQHFSVLNIGSNIIFLQSRLREISERINSCFIEPAGKPPRLYNSH